LFLKRVVTDFEKYIKFSSRHGLWTEVKKGVDYRDEGIRKGCRNVGSKGRPLVPGGVLKKGVGVRAPSEGAQKKFEKISQNFEHSKF